MAFFKVKVDGKVYELERLTLGDTVVLKKRFGLTDLQEFSPSDPEAMLGLLTLAISKQDGLSLAEATEQASDIDWEDFEPVEADNPESDPQVAAGNAATEAPAKTGNSGTRPKKPGPPN